MKTAFSLSALAILSTLLVACSDGGGDDPVNTTEIVLPAARGLVPELNQADATFEAEYHAGNAVCTSCHDSDRMTVPGPVQGESRNLSIGKAWRTSMMAQATRDPYWHAVVADELHRYPELSDTINTKCTICHAPLARDMSAKDGIDWQMFDSGSEENGDFVQGLYSMDSSSEVFNHAMDGVSCTLCHQMEGTNFGTPEGMSGNYDIVGSPTGDPLDRPAYGQYDDPEGTYMTQQSGFKPLYGPHLGQSESCATCHNLDVAGVDQDGAALAIPHFSEQAVFTEWQNSDFAVGGPQEASCQDCHMPVAEYPVYLSSTGGVLRDNFREHTMLGPNTIMQSMIRDYAEELGVPVSISSDDFNESIERNRAFLESAATLTIENGSLLDGTLRFDVKVMNHTGHKLPSAYHSRRAWLHIQVLDADAELVFESGAVDEQGKIAGVAEDVNPANWEVHYDKITSGAQVQVYQAIVANEAGERTHSLLNVSHYLKDNRLLPAGFDKTAVQNDTTLPDTFGVFGAALGDNDFDSGADTVSYEIDLVVNVEDGEGGEAEAALSDRYTVVAELRYQPFSFGHLMELFTRSDKIDQIDMFRTIYDGTELRSEVIDAATAAIE